MSFSYASGCWVGVGRVRQAQCLAPSLTQLRPTRLPAVMRPLFHSFRWGLFDQAIYDRYVYAHLASRFHSNVPTNDLPVRKPSTSYWTQVPQTCGSPTRTARHVHRVPRNLTLASRPPMKKVVSLPLYNTAQAPFEELWRETRYLLAV